MWAYMSGRADAERMVRASEARRLNEIRFAESELVEIDVMLGIEFEDFVASRLRHTGWHVTKTAVTGDFGVNLVARMGEVTLAVQCKRHSKPVGVSAVQQVVAGAMHHMCTASMVVSNQGFTKAAKQLALTHDCILIGRTALPTWNVATAERDPDAG